MLIRPRERLSTYVHMYVDPLVHFSELGGSSLRLDLAALLVSSSCLASLISDGMSNKISTLKDLVNSIPKPSDTWSTQSHWNWAETELNSSVRFHHNNSYIILYNLCKTHHYLSGPQGSQDGRITLCTLSYSVPQYASQRFPETAQQCPGQPLHSDSHLQIRVELRCQLLGWQCSRSNNITSMILLVCKAKF